MTRKGISEERKEFGELLEERNFIFALQKYLAEKEGDQYTYLGFDENVDCISKTSFVFRIYKLDQEPVLLENVSLTENVESNEPREDDEDEKKEKRKGKIILDGKTFPLIDSQPYTTTTTDTTSEDSLHANFGGGEIKAFARGCNTLDIELSGKHMLKGEGKMLQFCGVWGQIIVRHKRMSADLKEESQKGIYEVIRPGDTLLSIKKRDNKELYNDKMRDKREISSMSQFNTNVLEKLKADEKYILTFRTAGKLEDEVFSFRTFDYKHDDHKWNAYVLKFFPIYNEDLESQNPEHEKLQCNIEREFELAKQSFDCGNVLEVYSLSETLFFNKEKMQFDKIVSEDITANHTIKFQIMIMKEYDTDINKMMSRKEMNKIRKDVIESKTIDKSSWEELRKLHREFVSNQIIFVTILLPQIFKAFSCIHGDEKIVHRDVKPGNFFLNEKDGKYHVFISDFEAAKVLKKVNVEEHKKFISGKEPKKDCCFVKESCWRESETFESLGTEEKDGYTLPSKEEYIFTDKAGLDLLYTPGYYFDLRIPEPPAPISSYDTFSVAASALTVSQVDFFDKFDSHAIVFDKNDKKIPDCLRFPINDYISENGDHVSYNLVKEKDVPMRNNNYERFKQAVSGCKFSLRRLYEGTNPETDTQELETEEEKPLLRQNKGRFLEWKSCEETDIVEKRFLSKNDLYYADAIDDALCSIWKEFSEKVLEKLVLAPENRMTDNKARKELGEIKNFAREKITEAMEFLDGVEDSQALEDRKMLLDLITSMENSVS
eukprot:g6484.t1